MSTQAAQHAHARVTVTYTTAALSQNSQRLDALSSSFWVSPTFSTNAVKSNTLRLDDTHLSKVRISTLCDKALPRVSCCCVSALRKSGSARFIESTTSER